MLLIKRKKGNVLVVAKNKNLHKAKKNKNDEFYTRREDIESELRHYQSFFENKIVYCNCDPTESEFWQFFVRNFKPWKLKKLIATHYEPDEKNYAYKLELSEDTNVDGKSYFNNEPIITQMSCNGDFRNQACIDLLKEADIVVTNPPFSLITEYISQLIEYDKKFVIVGPFSAISRQEIFKLFKNNQIWLGYGFPNGNAYFRIPPENTSEYAKGVYDAKTGLVKFRNCTWFTNLDIQKRREKLDLRGNYYTPDKYPKYYNYDAIDVKRVANIPSDYYGNMGVPITYMEQHNCEQFEIIGRGNDVEKNIIHTTAGNEIHFIDAKTNEIVYRVQYTVKERKAGNSLRLDDNGKPGAIPYSRIIIKRKDIYCED